MKTEKKRYLYHGTTKAGKKSILRHGIRLDANHGNQDFGSGFYLTSTKGIAKGRREDGALLAYTLDMSHLNVKFYDTWTDEWKEEIFQQRVYGNDVSRAFDCVVGPIADGHIYDLVEAFRNGEISKADFCSGIVNKNWEKKWQYVIKTPKGIEALTREREAER